VPIVVYASYIATVLVTRLPQDHQSGYVGLRPITRRRRSPIQTFPELRERLGALRSGS
jgi:hypothetical protein